MPCMYAGDSGAINATDFRYPVAKRLKAASIDRFNASSVRSSGSGICTIWGVPPSSVK